MKVLALGEWIEAHLQSLILGDGHADGRRVQMGLVFDSERNALDACGMVDWKILLTGAYGNALEVQLFELVRRAPDEERVAKAMMGEDVDLLVEGVTTMMSKEKDWAIGRAIGWRPVVTNPQIFVRASGWISIMREVPDAR